MPGQPLQPFHVPTSLSMLPGSASIGMIAEWFLYFILVVWALYTLVAIYHWIKYSHASLVAYPAIALHLLVSIALIAYAVSGTL